MLSVPSARGPQGLGLLLVAIGRARGSLTAGGLAAGGFAAGAAAARPLQGRWSDRYGARPVVLLSGVAHGLILTAIAVAALTA